MIVKVKTVYGFAMYDDVQEFEYCICSGKYPIVVSSDTDDYRVEATDDLDKDLVIVNREVASVVNHDNIVNMEITRVNGSKRRILSYGHIYILNDEGKTIDKIHN